MKLSWSHAKRDKRPTAADSDPSARRVDIESAATQARTATVKLPGGGSATVKFPVANESLITHIGATRSPHQ